MMIGNSNIHEGDLIRVIDIRQKGGVMNTSSAAVGDLTKSIAEKVDEIQSEVKTRNKIQRANLSISAFENVYFAWKVKHYLGPSGLWTSR